MLDAATLSGEPGASEWPTATQAQLDALTKLSFMGTPESPH